LTVSGVLAMTRCSLSAPFAQLGSVPSVSDTSSEMSVKDPPFRARGDGETDDTAAVQAAINAAASVGRAAYLPSGKYRLDSPLHIHTSIRGNGPGTVLQPRAPLSVGASRVTMRDLAIVSFAPTAVSTINAKLLAVEFN